MRDKEDLFKDFIADLRRKEKEESKNLKEKVELPSGFLLRVGFYTVKKKFFFC